MSLVKGILFGKERRKAYRKEKAIDVSCRNHGSCPCRLGKMHSNVLRAVIANEKLIEYMKDS